MVDRIRKQFLVWGIVAFLAAPVVSHAVTKTGTVSKGAKTGDAQQTQAKTGVKKAANPALEKARESARAAKKVVVARVNGAPVTMYQLVRKMNVMAPKFIKRGERPDAEKTEELKRAALDTLIFEELAYQYAKKHNIKPSPARVDSILTNVRMSLGPEENYKAFLERLDLTEDQYIKVIERGQTLDLVFQKEIFDKVKVDEKAVKDLYEKEKDRLILPERYEVTDVVFLGKTADTKKKAQEVLAKIKEKGNDPWKLVQDGTFIVRDYGVRKDRNPGLYEAMQKLNPGDLSGVVEDKDGYHIIRVEKKEESRVATLEEARKYLERKLKGPFYKKRQEEWEEELKKDAKIEIYWDKVGLREKKGEKGAEKAGKAS